MADKSADKSAAILVAMKVGKKAECLDDSWGIHKAAEKADWKADTTAYAKAAKPVEMKVASLALILVQMMVGLKEDYWVGKKVVSKVILMAAWTVFLMAELLDVYLVVGWEIAMDERLADLKEIM